MNLLLWFRNDLRTHDNPALHYFISQLNDTHERHAVFFICEKQWRQHDWSTIKIDFIKRHAIALKQELQCYGITLSIIDVENFHQQCSYIKDYCQQHKITQVVANSELEFNEQQRDLNCIEQGIPLRLFEADVIVPKGKVLNKSGQFFKVFTPFKKAWLRYVSTYGFEYLGKLATAAGCTQDTIEQNDTDNSLNSRSRHWPLSIEFESSIMPMFLSDKVQDYADKRDFPSFKATSGASPYLAAGLVSPRFILFSLQNRYPDILLATDATEFSWLNEIIWREFYRHLMFHEQRLCKHQSFNPKYADMPWHQNHDLFSAWCQGKTGYPLVDAAMRQLNQTGWMHNRLRMVVASFLSKHLLLDWRLGERYFMQQLIDGDLAANNGGWQWAASTGCDAQPYFRVFNPIRQSERFDPDGHFIRKYIPELANIPIKHLHFPHDYIEQQQLDVYWQPLVDHKSARLRAIAFYK